jgi:hypothetical protein
LRFVEKAKRYTGIPELTGEFLHLFIEHIEARANAAERYFRTAEQKIGIRCRDIGILGAFAEKAQKQPPNGKGRQRNLLPAITKPMIQHVYL